MILLIKHRLDWELTRKKKQTQINRDNNRENKYRAGNDYKVGDNAMLSNHNSYKYQTSHKGPFVITQCFTNGTVKL